MSTEAKSNKSPTESVEAETDEKLPLDSNGADAKNDKPERVKFDMNACMIERGISGKVMWYSPFKGFGFLSRDDKQPDVFVHVSDIVRISRHDRVLTEGEEVEFDVVRGHRGPEAAAVTGKGGKVINAYAYRVGEAIRIYRNPAFYRKRRNEAKDEKAEGEIDKVSVKAEGEEKIEDSTSSSEADDGSTGSTGSSTEDAKVEKENRDSDAKKQQTSQELQNGKDAKPQAPAKADGKQSSPRKPQAPAKANGKPSSPQKSLDSKKEAQKTAQEPNTEKKKAAQEPKVEVQKVAQDQKSEKSKAAQELAGKQQQPAKQNANTEKPKTAQKKTAQKKAAGKK